MAPVTEKRARAARYFRSAMYLFFSVAGVLAMIWPAQVILTVFQIGLVYTWAGFLLIGGASSLFGTLKKTWAGELVGLPLLAVSNLIFGIALMSFGQTSASWAIGWVFVGVSCGLGARWLDLRSLVKISEEVGGNGVD